MQQTQQSFDVGTIHETTQHGPLKIIGLVEGRPDRRQVKFITTGFMKEVSTESISKGTVKDPSQVSAHRGGCLGHDPSLEKHPLRKMLYSKWYAMMQRSNPIRWNKQRNPWNKCNGKAIDPDWMNFSTFMKDVLEIPGAELLYACKDPANEVHLNSDIIATERGVPPTYCKENCKWIPRSYNDQIEVFNKKNGFMKEGKTFETIHGPVTLVASEKGKWTLRFDDGKEKTYWWIAVTNNDFTRP